MGQKVHWYVDVLKKYATFSGRAQRAEYWYFALFNFIIIAVLMGIDTVLNLGGGDMGVGLLSGIYSLAVLIPGLAVAVRRLHDTDHSGWWLFIGLIPVIGFIVLLIWFVKDSQPGENSHGPNPKGVLGASAGSSSATSATPPAATGSTTTSTPPADTSAAPVADMPAAPATDTPSASDADTPEAPGADS